MSKAQETFIIKDVVEMGHLKYIGGSIEIAVHFDTIVPSTVIEKCLEAIDSLDHCLVTDNHRASEFSQRYFLLDSCCDLYQDVVSIITYLLLDVLNISAIEVQYGKCKYKSEPVIYSDVVEYSVQG